MKQNVRDIAPFEIVNGYHARMIHSDNLTLAYVQVESGAPLPEHRHIHEQITSLLEGSFELTVDGEVLTLEAGDVVVIPSNVPHSGRALTDCRLMDVFNPVREDFKNRDVAYGNKAAQ